MTDARCPSLVDLFAKEPTPAVEEHVARCPRCQALRASGDERVAVEPPEEEERERLERVEPEAGTVALLAAPDSDEYMPTVVAKVGEDALTVVPLSEQVQLASDWDLKLDRLTLGYEAIAEVWNYGSALPEQIVEQVAKLPVIDFENVRAMLRAIATGAPRPDGLPVGPPVLDEADPRLLFQDEEAARAHSFWEPTLALAGAATLGQLVVHRREELQVPVEELEAVTMQQAGWLSELERDALDIRSVLTTKALADLMRRLRVGGSRRLGRLAALTIESQGGAAGIESGAAFARSRRGYRQAPGEQSVEEYVEDFLRELEK
jgi:hypothetical protein